MLVISFLLSMLGGQHLCTVFITARYSENGMHYLLVRLNLLVSFLFSCSLFAEVAKCNIVSFVIVQS